MGYYAFVCTHIEVYSYCDLTECKLAVTGLEGYINICVYFTVIRGPQERYSLMGSSIN